MGLAIAKSCQNWYNMPRSLRTYVVTLKCWPKVDIFAARLNHYSASVIAIVLSLDAQLVFLDKRKFAILYESTSSSSDVCEKLSRLELLFDRSWSHFNNEINLPRGRSEPIRSALGVSPASARKAERIIIAPLEENISTMNTVVFNEDSGCSFDFCGLIGD